MKYAIIKDGKIENVIEAEQAFAESIGAVLAGDNVTGDLWDGTTFTAPPPPMPVIPQGVTMRQARLALDAAGLLDTVNATIAAMTGQAGKSARIEWEFSSEVRRNQPLVMALGPTLGLTPVQLDALFTEAAKL